MKTHEQIEQLTRNAKSMGGIVIATCINKTDMNMIHCIKHHIDNEEYVVHDYNVEFDGFYNGYYSFDIDEAYKQFAKRITR